MRTVRVDSEENLDDAHTTVHHEPGFVRASDSGSEVSELLGGNQKRMPNEKTAMFSQRGRQCPCALRDRGTQAWTGRTQSRAMPGL